MKMDKNKTETILDILALVLNPNCIIMKMEREERKRHR